MEAFVQRLQLEWIVDRARFTNPFLFRRRLERDRTRFASIVRSFACISVA